MLLTVQRKKHKIPCNLNKASLQLAILGKSQLACTSPKNNSNNPKKTLMGRINSSSVI